MKWRKPSEELGDFLEAAVARFRADRRKMFGCPCYFVNGNMFAGIHQESMILRLDEADRERIQQEHDEVGPFEPMAGRPMREYVAVPESVITDEAELQEWLKRSHRFAASLPEKKPKKKAKKPKKAGTPAGKRRA